MSITESVPTLEQRIIGTIRLKHYSRKTEVSYVQWYKRYVNFQKEVCGKMRHPAEMGAPEVEAFLTHLAVNRNLAAASQNQALNALVFRYREVLRIELDGIQATRAKSVRHLPVVLTVDEVRELLTVVKGDSGLTVKLVYGLGLKVAELLALRVKDVDVGGGKLEVRSDKGDKDRVITLPQRLYQPITEHLGRVRAVYEADRREGVSGVHLPPAMAEKNPTAAESWPWMWFLPSPRVWKDKEADGKAWRSGERAYGRGRHHLHELMVSRELARASKLVQMSKRVTAHKQQHSFATHLILRGVDIRSIQELLGHADVRTPEIYAQLAKAMRGKIPSPLDDL